MRTNASVPPRDTEANCSLGCVLFGKSKRILEFKKKRILRFFFKDPKIDFECKEYTFRIDSPDQVLILRILDDYESCNGLCSYGPQK